MYARLYYSSTVVVVAVAEAPRWAVLSSKPHLLSQGTRSSTKSQHMCVCVLAEHHVKPSNRTGTHTHIHSIFILIYMNLRVCGGLHVLVMETFVPTET